MKKLFLAVVVLISAVICTACVNNLAIQELNNKAKAYLKAGDAESAICRLKASLDLDDNFFETNYNLAVTYIAKKNWNDAFDALEHAMKINPDFVDSYYSLGIIYEGKADEIVSSTQYDEDDVNDVEEQDLDKFDNDGNVVLSDEEKADIVEYYTKAIDAYNKFIEKSVDTNAKNDVKKIIENINKEIAKYTGESIEIE